MDGRSAVIGVLAVVVLGVVGGTGAVLIDSSGGGDAPATATTAETPASTDRVQPNDDGDGGDSGDGDGGDGRDGDGSSTESPTPAPTTPKPNYQFAFDVTGTERCGTTCRDVTVRLEHRGTKTARNVAVTTRILVKGDGIWKGTERIGEMDAGDTATRTKRVTLSWMEAAKVKRNDGYVTIGTTVTWAGGKTSFEERRKVA